MEHFLRTYGYAGIVLSTFFGAEEGVLLSAFLAADGFLSLPGIILASAIGGSAGDQVYYYIALRYGDRLLNRFDSLRRSYPKAQRLVNRYGVAVVLASRFLAGIRIAVAVLCGTLKIRPILYTPLSLASGLLWASFYAVLSYEFGRVVLEWLPETKHVVLYVILVLLFGMVVVGRLIALRRKPRAEPDSNHRPRPGADEGPRT